MGDVSVGYTAGSGTDIAADNDGSVDIQQIEIVGAGRKGNGIQRQPAEVNNNGQLSITADDLAAIFRQLLEGINNPSWLNKKTNLLGVLLDTNSNLNTVTTVSSVSNVTLVSTLTKLIAVGSTTGSAIPSGDLTPIPQTLTDQTWELAVRNRIS